MQTVINNNGINYTMSLTRDSEQNKYVLQFTSHHRFVGGTETHTFEDFTTAWDHYVRNCHYYNVVVPEPLTEEQFLGIPSGTLYKEPKYA